MLTQRTGEALPIGEATCSLLPSIAKNVPLNMPVHYIDLLPGSTCPDPLYQEAAQLIGKALCSLGNKSYVADTVLDYGGTAVFKHHRLLPGERHDEMDWHVDIRKALVIGSIAGTELLTGDTRQLLFQPRIAAWLRLVEERQQVSWRPEDDQLCEAGLQIRPLAPDTWYELREDTVHRAPRNEFTGPVDRMFLGITPKYHLS